MKLRPLTLLLISVLISGCTGTKPSHYSGPSIQASGTDKPELITKSLFDSKDRTISEDDIQRLLNGTIRLPDTVRVAVFKFGRTSINRYYTNWWNDEEFLKTQQSFIDTLTRQISTAGKVKKVIPIPALMTSANPTITQVRETAVRLKADVLVVYSVTSDIYSKYKVFQRNEAKAYATCESILMDVRSGVIPHSTIITNEKMIRKSDTDFNDAETKKNAEREAINLTLSETGKRIAAFILNPDL
jgi:hypothetical protein